MNVGFPPDAPWSVFLPLEVAWIAKDTGRFIQFRLSSGTKFNAQSSFGSFIPSGVARSHPCITITRSCP